MSDMTEELIEISEPAQEVVAAEAPNADKPAPKKRGRKPKALTPPHVPVEAPKPVKKRRNHANVSKVDRAFNAAVTSAEKDRAKCIEELSKIMEQWDVKQARLKSLDWKISTLKGTTSTSSLAGMQLQSYAQQPAYPANMNYPPQPPAYPQQATSFVPPSMRQPSVPVDPRASGGSEGIVDDGGNAEEDQFLTNVGVVGSGKWVG